MPRYAEKVGADAAALQAMWDRRERRRERRRCGKCGRLGSGRRGHLFVGRTGRALLCGSCVK